MYSSRLEALLKKKKIALGDSITVTAGKKSISGILLPQTELGNPDVLVIKTRSGYNIGITPTAIEKSTDKHPKKTTKPRFIPTDSSKPPLTMISIGGTITSRIDYTTGGVTTLSTPTDILSTIPELAQITNLSRILTPFSTMSESMDYTDWMKLATICARELKKSSKGLIVTQGTDTLHFTAAALSYFLQDLPKPLVLTASQRSTDRGSSDAGLNVTCSAYVALSDIAEVSVCMHGSLNDDHCLVIRGTKVRKMDTQRRDAFRPINDRPLAFVTPDGTIQPKQSYNKRSTSPVKKAIHFNPHIALLQTYPGSDPSVMDYLINKGCKGVILQASGLGQVPLKNNSWLPSIENAVSSDIPVFLTPQTLYGRLNPTVYAEGRRIIQAGALPLEDMLPETAYVKLGWVLGKTRSLKKIQERMLHPVAGDITPRTHPDTFLY